MIVTDTKKRLTMLMDETSSSFSGAENKKSPMFAAVVRKVLYVNGVGFPTGCLVHLRRGKISSLWLASASDKSRKLLGGSL